MMPAPARWIDAQEASLDPLRGRRITVAGYGNQGRAQALNLRDTLEFDPENAPGHASGGGLEHRAATTEEPREAIVVWARPEGRSAERARADGFRVIGDGELGESELILCLLPDDCHAAFFRDVAGPAVERAARGGPRPGGSRRGPGPSLCFAHGFSLIHSALGQRSREEPWGDVMLVAPCGPGADVRERFVQGGGIPGYLAVWEDRSGTARAQALALAAALGLTRAGLLETSVADEVAVDLFGEQSVVCGGLNALLRAAFDTLVAAGYAPEMAYLECVQQIGLTAGMVQRYGVGGMRERISRTALYGDLVQGPRLIDDQVRARMAEILHEVESGQFARQWVAQIEAGDPVISRWSRERMSDAFDKIGQDVRRRVKGSKPVDTSGTLD